MKIGDCFDRNLALENVYYLINLKNNKIVKISKNSNKLMPKAGPNSPYVVKAKGMTMGWTY